MSLEITPGELFRSLRETSERTAALVEQVKALVERIEQLEESKHAQNAKIEDLISKRDQGVGALWMLTTLGGIAGGALVTLKTNWASIKTFFNS